MSAFDFGYSWYWTHGHLVPFGAALLLLAVALWRRWRRWVAVVAGVIAVWSFVGFLIVQLVLQMGSPTDLPTESFARSGAARVVDLGAGSGRSTLMVLLSRPQSRVTALDIYRGYWGIEGNTPERLRSNARAAGVEDRLEVQTGDMREMPFEDASFDAAVSAYAIDHLDREGVKRALAEVARVLRPGGQLLIMNVHVDAWMRIAYPLPPGHSYFSTQQSVDRWRSALEAAGLELVEQGTRPGTLYFLGRKR